MKKNNLRHRAPASPLPKTHNLEGAEPRGPDVAARVGLSPGGLVPLGRIVNVHGMHGEVRLLPFNPDSTACQSGGTVILRRNQNQEFRRVTGVRRHKRFLLLSLRGCESMPAAAALVGSEVCIPEEDLPPPGPDEIYHYQLVGMTVITTAGRVIGIVTSVMTTGSNDVCVVRDDSREHLIPLIADVVKQVDRAERRLVIEPLAGLLEG